VIVGAKIRITGHLAMPKRQLAEIEKRAFVTAMRLWHREMLPKHFEEGADNVYKYERRTRRYVERKQRQKGHKRPLVWSGASRDMALRKIEIRPTKKQTKGIVHVAKAFNFSGRFGMPDMKAEVSKILKREACVIRKVIGDEVAKGLSADVSVKVVTI